MRRLTVILTAALVAAAASAQLQWEETAWDFGIIKEADGKVAHRFAYRNGGADTVVVRRTSSSCGCTTARLADTVILPGDSGSLLVEFNPSYRPGPFKKHVAVHTDKGTTQLQIAGKVRPEGETVGRIFPEKAGDLRLTSRTAVVGDVRQGHRRQTSVIAYNASRDTLSLSFESADKRIGVVAEPSVVAPGDLTSFSIVFQTDSADETGRADTQIAVKANGRSVGVITATAQVVAAHPEKVDYASAPQLRLRADRVDFTPIGTKKIMRSVEIENIGKADLHITGTGTMDDAVAVKKTARCLKPGRKGKICITLDPSKMADGRLLNSSVVIFTNDPLQGTVQIRTVGTTETDKKQK